MSDIVLHCIDDEDYETVGLPQDNIASFQRLKGGDCTRIFLKATKSGVIGFDVTETTEEIKNLLDKPTIVFNCVADEAHESVGIILDNIASYQGYKDGGYTRIFLRETQSNLIAFDVTETPEKVRTMIDSVGFSNK